MRDDGQLVLGGDEAHVWTARIEYPLPPRQVARWLPLLSGDETDHLEQLWPGAMRAEYLVTRVLCRTTLSRYATVAPQAWRFLADRDGRPAIDLPRAYRALRFNLSHAGGLVACAVRARGEIGVDVEARGKHIGLAVARRYFSAAEVESLLEIAPERRREQILRLWTLKEAYIKAKGRGLSLPLDSFSIGFAPAGITLAADDDASGNRWQLSLHDHEDSHVLALCVLRRQAGAEIDVRFFPAWN